MVQVVGVSLNQFYRLDLKDMNSQGPNVAHQVQWNTATGPKMKMRQFFANANWAQQIHSVDVSTSGAKGGVVFLYKKRPNSDTAENFPAFVVKYTVAPERMLFAEHLLKTIAGAKIPKSLPVYLDWSDQDCPGLELMALLQDQRNWRFMANKQRNFSLNQDKKSRYQAFLQTIDADRQADRYSYLVIMKAFTGALSLMDPSPIDEWLIAAGYTQPQAPGAPDVAATSTTWQTIVGDRKLRDVGLRTRLLGLIRRCNLNKKILSSEHWTQYLGWILAADTLAGNADRVEETNVGNFFFYDRPDLDPDRKHPIAVIDNDALMPRFSYDLHPAIKANMAANSSSVDQYLRYALVTGKELPPPGGAQGLAMQLAPLSNLRTMFGNFDLMFSTFFSKIMAGDSSYPLLATLYADDGTLAQQLGMPDVGPGDHRPFSRDINSREWQTVKADIMHGMVDAIDFLQNDPHFYNECQQQYIDLATYYQDDQDLNFDFTAFLARYQYLRQIVIDPGHGTFAAADHDAVVAEVKRRVFDAKPIEPYVAGILLFGKNQNLLTADEASKYQDYVATLDTESQPKRIAVPMANSHNWTKAGLVTLPAGWEAPNTQGGYLKSTGATASNPLKLINDAIQNSHAAIVGASLGKKTAINKIDTNLWLLKDEENGFVVRVEDANGQFDVQWDVYGMRILATNAVLLKYFGIRLEQQAAARGASLLPSPPPDLVWHVVLPEVAGIRNALAAGKAFKWDPKPPAQNAMRTLQLVTGVDLYKRYKT